jgi:CheY-specific phosphatase CheX
MAPNDRLNEIFFQSASEVLETMCFVGVLGENAGVEDVDPISAELVFQGSPSGRFGVQVSPETGKLVASNFLGKDSDELTDADVEQVVGELANMICGSVLSRLEAGARFELGQPTILRAAEGTPHTNAIQYRFDLEEGSIILWMNAGDALPVCSAA